VGHQALMAARNQLLGMTAKDPRLVGVRPNSMEDVPEYRIDVDWQKAGALGVPINSIHDTIVSAFGSAYVNDFIQAGRVKRVYVQADAPFRMLPRDLERLYVRNTAAKMVPFLLLPPDIGLPVLPSWSATMAFRPSTYGARRHRERAPGSDEGHGRDRLEAPPSDRL